MPNETIALRPQPITAAAFAPRGTKTFFNLEWADTNQVDDHACEIGQRIGKAFEPVGGT